MNKKTFKGLSSRDYEHPLDRTALQTLEKTPGLPMLVSKFNKYWTDKVLRIQYCGSNLQVTKQTLPEVYDLLLEACRILDIEKIPNLYIERGYEINAFTAGVEDPIVVLNSACLDNLSNDELLFIIGHELGHIKSKHVLYHQIARQLPALGGILGDFTLGIGKLIAGGLQVALLNWMRMSEFTADRAGLLTCQNPDVAASAMMKIAGLPNKYYNTADVKGFIQQARDFEEYDEETMDKAIKALSIVGSSHPWTVMRASEFYKWTDSGEYNDILKRFEQISFCAADSEKVIVQCEHCFLKMRVPANKGAIIVTCPSCNREFKTRT